MSAKARLIAFYLPQFHPVKENDQWWGPGFTEWTNVARARPLFRGHNQPKIPGELGFYDLRIPEVRLAQAALAREYGIEGFCYWHYWFGNGKRLLEMPFSTVVTSGQPDFPFCLCWCNISWGGRPYGDLFNRLLMEQTYPGKQDIVDHFNALKEAFADSRYLKVNGKNVFLIYNPAGLVYGKSFMDTWNELARAEGLPEFYFLAYAYEKFDARGHGYEGQVVPSPNYFFKSYDKEQNRVILKLKRKLFRALKITKRYPYKELVKYSDFSGFDKTNFYPSVFPNWDHTPRSKHLGTMAYGSTPELFGEMLRKAVNTIKVRPSDERVVFIKAWNEWAEGNYLEPDSLHGRSYLEAIRKAVQED